LAGGAFCMGDRYATGAAATSELKTERKEATAVKQKNVRALAVGVRTQQAQDEADTFFQHLRTEYENDQNKPGTGCVLDPVSLRRWNDANAQSDGPATGEPDDEMPAAAESSSGAERSE
ncbi:MAG: hypothetical protein K2Y02_01445, partial [Burkholderiaceae bacterium]|nr:hypothetical protein [Burkholderiaceae bacterium]